MYVIKIVRDSILINASLYEKYWSEEMLSNNFNLINSKNFLFRFSAHRWINKQVCQELFTKKELEIIDG